MLTNGRYCTTKSIVRRASSLISIWVRAVWKVLTITCSACFSEEVVVEAFGLSYLSNSSRAGWCAGKELIYHTVTKKGDVGRRTGTPLYQK